MNNLIYDLKEVQQVYVINRIDIEKSCEGQRAQNSHYEFSNHTD